MKEFAITENHLYSKVYSGGKKSVTRTVVVYILRDLKASRLKKENPLKKYINRVGLTVTKKIGGAVTRNRCKRVLREAFRHINKVHKLKTGFLIVLVAREATTKVKTAEVEADMTAALTKLGMFADEPRQDDGVRNA